MSEFKTPEPDYIALNLIAKYSSTQYHFIAASIRLDNPQLIKCDLEEEGFCRLYDDTNFFIDEASRPVLSSDEIIAKYYTTFPESETRVERLKLVITLGSSLIKLYKKNPSIDETRSHELFETEKTAVYDHTIVTTPDTDKILLDNKLRDLADPVTDIEFNKLLKKL